MRVRICYGHGKDMKTKDFEHIKTLMTYEEEGEDIIWFYEGTSRYGDEGIRHEYVLDSVNAIYLLPY